MRYKLEQTPRINIPAIAAFCDKRKRLIIWACWGLLIGVIPLAIPLNWGNSPAPQLGWKFFIPPTIGGVLGGLLSLIPAKNWKGAETGAVLGAIVCGVIGILLTLLTTLAGNPVQLKSALLLAMVGAGVGAVISATCWK